ncbi:hypothetical protein NDA10_003650 [Ustilago hordei]|nr:hypothetical protein NDA10_003650 [Ustilago hordei]
MNALISASDIKTFYSALHCLSRFSETFWLQCSPKIGGQSQIRLSAINPTNSAFCMFVFDPDFFLSVTTESSSKLECQIQLKSILSILRTRGRAPHRQASASIASGQGETSLPSHPQPVPPLAHAIPTESTPHPQHLAKHPEDEGDADETQPLFFPGASQLSLQPTPQESAGEREPEQTFVQPTPVAQGGDPSEFLPSQSSSAPPTQQQQQQHQRDAFRTESHSDADSEQDDERGGMPRKRFKPLF